VAGRDIPPTYKAPATGSPSEQEAGHHLRVKYFVGLLAVVAAVAAATAAGYRLWDNTTSTQSKDNGGVLGGPSSTLAGDAPAPADGEVFVNGSVNAAHVEGAVLPSLATPLTIATPQRGEGAGATIQGIHVNGEPASIEWDAGRPLELSGEGGSLLLEPVVVDIGDGAARVTLDGQPHGFTPGTYTINTPVAVAISGLGEPADRVTFTATPDSRIEFRGGASADLPDAAQLSGQGTLTLEGAPSVVHPDRTITTGPTVTLDSGTYQVRFTSDGNGGYTVKATLAGTVR
jgi:hypothetical protein